MIGGKMIAKPIMPPTTKNNDFIPKPYTPHGIIVK